MSALLTNQITAIFRWGLYNLFKDCPLIGWTAFIILTIYSIKWQNILLHSRFGRQECKNYLLLHSTFTFTLECSVFPIQSSDICSSKNEANKKEYVWNSLCRANAVSTMWAFSVMQGSAYKYFPHWVGRAAWIMLCLSLSHFQYFFL